MSHSIHIDALDRTGGNGSRTTEEDWLDQHTTSAENEWSSAKTTFYYWEAPEHKQHNFKRFYNKQHGKDDPNRSSELPRMRALADAKAFCAILNLNKQLTERIIYIMEEIDMDSNTFGGKSYEKLILAICSLVYDEHLSSMPVDSIQYGQRLIFDETFRDLMESNELGSNELRGVREQVRTKTEFF